MEWLKKFKWYIVTFVLLIVSGLLYFLSLEEEIDENLFPVNIEENYQQLEKNTIYVDLKGAVVKEGVYVLEEGARIKDVIELAGGFLPDANKHAINLAQLLSDEMLLHVPYQSDDINEGQLATTVDDGKVNLNTASQSELETLPGIGPSKALAIIDYRETNGGFKTIDDLKKIGGIGDKTFEKLKEHIKTK